MRATITGYGRSENEVDFMEVVIHENNGKVIKSKIIKSSDMDVDKATDIAIDFCKKNNSMEIHMVSEIVKVEQCGCGEWSKRVVTDEDIRRANATNTTN